MNKEGIVRIESVSDFMGIVEDITSGFAGNQTFIYRGISNADYSLIPSIYRTYKNGSILHHIYLENNSERSIMQQFMTEAAAFISSLSVDDRFLWVEYAQHFGTPTRLLDWTLNPLVALYFACICHNDYSQKIPDGKVYCLNDSIYKKISFGTGKNQINDSTIKEEAAKMIWDNENTFPYPIVFRPYYFDKRMSAQSSCFMVWGSERKPLNELIDELERSGKGSAKRRIQANEGIMLISYENTALTSYTIPGAQRLKILRELDSIGINRSTLFPGLDGIGAAIERRSNSKYMNPYEI